MKPKTQSVWQKLNKEASRNPLVLMLAYDALLKQVDTILADEEKTVEILKKSMVDGRAWVATAKEVRKILLSK